MKTETIRVWITKHALTKGVYEIIVEQCSLDDTVKGPGTFEYYHGKGREWHLTKQSANKHAEILLAKKVKSLQKQLDRLRKTVFL